MHWKSLAFGLRKRVLPHLKWLPFQVYARPYWISNVGSQQLLLVARVPREEGGKQPEDAAEHRVAARVCAAAAGRRRPGRVCAHVGAPCVGGPAARGAAPCSGGVCAQRRVALHPWVHGVVCCLGAGRTRHGGGACRAWCPWDVGRVGACECVAPTRWDVDAAVSVVRAVRCGGVVPLVARCACGGVVVGALLLLWRGVFLGGVRAASGHTAWQLCACAGPGAGAPACAVPTADAEMPLAPGSMLR